MFLLYTSISLSVFSVSSETNKGELITQQMSIMITHRSK